MKKWEQCLVKRGKVDNRLKSQPIESSELRNEGSKIPDLKEMRGLIQDKAHNRFYKSSLSKIGFIRPDYTVAPMHTYRKIETEISNPGCNESLA